MEEIFVEREIHYNLQITNSIYARKTRTTAYGLENISFLGGKSLARLTIAYKEVPICKTF